MKKSRVMKVGTVAIVFAAALAAISPVLAQDAPPPSGRKVEYSPYPAKTFPNRVYFGDTHLHTSYSADAGMVGNTVNVNEATYTNAIGAPATIQERAYSSPIWYTPGPS